MLEVDVRGLRIGWTGYTALRRDLIAPIGSVDQYYPALLDIYSLTGNPVYWMPLKCIFPGCHVPNSSALPDEKLVHQNVLHYSDNFKEVMRFVNSSPSVDRHRWLVENRPPKTLLKYFDYPTLDVLIVESTGQMGGAYGINEVAWSCWEKNPNLGIILIDQDLTAPTTLSKIKKWLPHWEERVIIATYHFHRKSPRQVVSIIPQLEYLQLPFSQDHDYLECAYVGNDYNRREPMQRFFRHPRMVHYGRVKDDFTSQFTQMGGTVRGPFTPSSAYTLEQLYAYHGAGLNIVREDAYTQGLITGRLAEISRAGVIAFCDHKLRTARVLVTDWFFVQNVWDVIQKMDFLVKEKQFWYDSFCYQNDAIRRYVGRERYVEALMTAAWRLVQGPIRGRWCHNPYNDLLYFAGLPQWRNGEGG